MDTETQKLCKDLRDLIGGAKDYSNTDLHTVFTDLETIISAMAYLITPLMELESLYRNEIVQYMEKGDSHAKAQEKGKIGENYKNWKKVEMLYALAEQQIMLGKKFQSGLDMEYKRTR